MIDVPYRSSQMFVFIYKLFMFTHKANKKFIYVSDNFSSLLWRIFEIWPVNLNYPFEVHFFAFLIFSFHSEGTFYHPPWHTSHQNNLYFFCNCLTGLRTSLLLWAAEFLFLRLIYGNMAYECLTKIKSV